MKVLLAHDWLVTMGGAESVLEEITAIYPDAPICTLFSNKKNIKNTHFHDAEIIYSSLQNIPFIQHIYRKIPQCFPMAIEEFDTGGYDVVISSSHAVAKGILSDAKTCHISYIHTPMRYIWDLTHNYLKQANFPYFIKLYTRFVFHQLRSWDLISSFRPDFLIANSHFIAARIEKIYRRKADVIYPPVKLSDAVYNNKENYYIAASRHVPYKNIPLIASAFTKMPEKKLVIVGDGPDAKKVQELIKGTSNIEYIGFQNRKSLMELIGKAKAFIFAAEEDFGILPVEAQSLGTPVIAYGVGGVRETVIHNKTGLFFDAQNEHSIIDAVKAFEKKEDQFDPSNIAHHAQIFSSQRFKEEFSAYIATSYKKFQKLT